MPSSLGGRSIVVVRQADENLAGYNFFKFDNSILDHIYGVNSFVLIDK